MLTPAAQFLTYAEAVALYNLLKEAGVEALVKTCGPPSFPFGDGMYYQLLIEQTDVPLAQQTVEAFELQRTTPPPLRCPRCRAEGATPLTRPAWWQRLYYAGTVLHQCPQCHTTFPV
ncbi:hypothetical protein KBK19_16415 [Microvirga sp. STR05]|uniref:DUF2007 domain-containing protein n=1 Tax=Hymenobacter duratus TaxID=2771356 RepID=A0ABR8JIG4_9BACT|nr:hypothetical protein [Hymenobacter duratus]MBD2716629.1 hypothetical protein [Hymenobacter duratus]MBR7951544.1 hypothetical protein [Microvirga sp. STR05]